jgi:hypothetical protein
MRNRCRRKVRHDLKLKLTTQQHTETPISDQASLPLETAVFEPGRPFIGGRDRLPPFPSHSEATSRRKSGSHEKSPPKSKKAPKSVKDANYTLGQASTGTKRDTEGVYEPTKAFRGRFGPYQGLRGRIGILDDGIVAKPIRYAQIFFNPLLRP